MVDLQYLQIEGSERNARDRLQTRPWHQENQALRKDFVAQTLRREDYDSWMGEIANHSTVY